ncbi:MAG: hypothetical protein ACPL4N_01075 [Candidatus Norongarragalinales archaeon]
MVSQKRLQNATLQNQTDFYGVTALSITALAAFELIVESNSHLGLALLGLTVILCAMTRDKEKEPRQEPDYY